MTRVVVLHLLSAGLTLALAVISLLRRRVRGARQLALLLFAAGWWAAFEAAITLTAGVEAKLLWMQVQYIGMAAAPLLFLRFALSYSGTETRLARAASAIVLPVCATTLAMVWTNPLHGLVWRAAHLDVTGRLLVLERGPWFWVFVAAAYLALLAGTLAVGSLALRTGRRLRAQALTVLAASLLPWIANALYVGGVVEIPGLDWTPITFTLTGLLLAFATLRLGFLALVPVARSAVVETMGDGVLVLDDEGMLVDFNPAAGRLIGIDESARPGATLPPLPPPLARVLAGARVDLHDEVMLEAGGRNLTIELRAAPLTTRSGKPLGRLIVLRDITDRRAAEKERERLVADLQNAVSEIRTLRGLLPICSSCKRVRDDSGYWSQIETYIGKHADVRFSHGLCPDCAKKLYPEVFDKEPPA